MSHVFHRHSKLNPPVAERGDGPYVIDHNGKRYLDASGGAAVSCLGHSHPRVIKAAQQQIGKLPYAHTAFFTNDAAEELAHRLIDHAPGDLDRVYFVAGGSEAMEASLKLARQYFLERGEPDRKLFIARHQSYHGNTLGALAVGGNQWRRRQFEPLMMETHHIAPCYAYREQHPTETEEDYGERAALELEHKLQALGPHNVIGFVCEPVVGATAGAVPAVRGYLRRIREICDRHGILLIFDEVMCGMGRTGHLYACEEDGAAPDIMTIAKGLGAGYQPIGAMLASRSIYDAIAKGSGFFQHGHTYLAHATACAAALEVQKVFEDEDLVAQVKIRGQELEARLQDRFGNHPHVGDIRGRGFFRGLEFVSDRTSKEPFPPQTALHTKLKAAAMDRGLMCYPMGGTIDGVRGHHVLIAPPFVVTDAQMGELVDKLGDATDAALAMAIEETAVK